MVLHEAYDGIVIVLLTNVLRARCKLLFYLAEIVERPAFDQALQLLQNIEMLGRITLTLLELGEVLNHALHIFNGVELGGTFLGLQKLVDMVLDFTGEVSKIGVHNFAIEKIIFT